MKVKYVDIPLQYQNLKSELLPKIESVLESGHFVFGPLLESLEKRFASHCSTKYAIGVANGTDALFLSLKALGIGTGDEVITAPNSFISTAAAIAHTGAKPVFADVREDFNLDPSKIENAITDKTKAIMPVHLTGRLSDMDPIIDIANKHNLEIIEDSAQAFGAKYNGKMAGSFGITGCFSLHPLKNLNAYGDGGIITTSNDDIYNKLIELRNHGLVNRDECKNWAFNSRLDAIQATIVDSKLDHIGEWNKKIKEIASIYREELQDTVTVPKDKPHEDPVYHTFIIQHNKRNELQQHLLNQGVETKIHYPIPIHLQNAASYLGYKKGDFPVCESQAERILSLPIYPELTMDQVKYVINEIKSFDNNKQV
ncbi:DegT/DnrJ/EryC1/StrS family aminotransferase [Nanoarchaeota archaeon]